MKSKQQNLYRWQSLFAMLLLIVATSTRVWGLDKKPSATPTPKPAAPAKPANKPTAMQPAGPQGRPNGAPNRPQNKPTSKPQAPTAPQSRPTAKPTDTKTVPPEPTQRPSGPGASTSPEKPVGRPSSHQPSRHETQVDGNRVSEDSHGRVREIERPGLRVEHHLRGGPIFRAEHSGRVIVGTGRNRGYMQRTYYSPNGRTYVQRTYVGGGRRHAVAYRSYRYRNVVYYRYAPAYYYHPAFYGWAYHPWAAPVRYDWGWAGNPWFAGYGYYFTPYATYAGASLWLTDYLLAEDLQLAYASHAEAASGALAAPAPADGDGAGNGQVALSPEVKKMIADEVQRQLAAEEAVTAQASSQKRGDNQTQEEVPAALDPHQKVFVVASDLDLVDDAGNECAVTAGDVLMRTGKTPDENNRVAVNVVSSKQGDCPVDTNSAVNVSDLQEMHNQFRETLDAGLKTLADNQGKNGLPAAPDTGTSAGEVAPPAPDASAESELQDQQRNVEQVEQKIIKNALGSSPQQVGTGPIPLKEKPDHE
jgi:hypothetical protein